MVPLDKVLQWKNVNKSHSGRFNNTHAYLLIFKHIHTYPDIIKHIQELFKHIQAYSELCKTLVYFES